MASIVPASTWYLHLCAGNCTANFPVHLQIMLAAFLLLHLFIVMFFICKPGGALLYVFILSPTTTAHSHFDHRTGVFMTATTITVAALAGSSSYFSLKPSTKSVCPLPVPLSVFQTKQREGRDNVHRLAISQPSDPHTVCFKPSSLELVIMQTDSPSVSLKSSTKSVAQVKEIKSAHCQPHREFQSKQREGRVNANGLTICQPQAKHQSQ